MNENPRVRRIGSVVHALDVLDCLAGATGSMRLSDIARSVGLDKSTVHRILGTLVERRVLIKDLAGEYRLGWKLYELGARVSLVNTINSVARAFLNRLAAATGESVLVGVLCEDEVLYIERDESPRHFVMVASPGRRAPVHTTASGKLLLAFSDAQTRRRVLSRPLVSATPDTIVDPAILERQCRDVVRLGYATCWREQEIGLSSIAVPIRDQSKSVVAALTLAGPDARLNKRSLPDQLRLLRQAGDEVTRALGG